MGSFDETDPEKWTRQYLDPPLSGRPPRFSLQSLFRESPSSNLYVKETRVKTPLENSQFHDEALEELIGTQALSVVLTWAESRRWAVGELVGRLK